MKTIKLKYYSDPAHGWVAVKRQMLVDLGILDSISVYSYQKGKSVYLEEGCDLAKLVTALQAANMNAEFDCSYTDKRHPIRSYSNFQP